MQGFLPGIMHGIVVRLLAVNGDGDGSMNIRRLQLDVDKATARPDLLELAEAIERSPGVEALNITVTDIDMETVGLEVTVEGQNIDAPRLIHEIEKTGAAVHSIDEVVAGARVIERVPRIR